MSNVGVLLLHYLENKSSVTVEQTRRSTPHGIREGHLSGGDIRWTSG